MTKPRNMTPEQEAEWKTRRQKSLSKYNKSEKRKSSLNRYRSNPEKRHRDNAVILARQTSENGKSTRRSIHRKLMETDEVYRKKKLEESRRRNLKLKIAREFDRAMARLLMGEDVYGIGGFG